MKFSQDTSESRELTRLCSSLMSNYFNLTIMFFRLQEDFQLSDFNRFLLLEHLNVKLQLNGSNKNTSSWSLVCLGCLFSQYTWNFSDISQVWKYAIRKLQDRAQQPVACFCLATILDSCPVPEREQLILLHEMADNHVLPSSGSFCLEIAIQKLPIVNTEKSMALNCEILSNVVSFYSSFEEIKTDLWNPEVVTIILPRYLHMFCKSDIDINLPQSQYGLLSRASQRESENKNLYNLYLQLYDNRKPFKSSFKVPTHEFSYEESNMFKRQKYFQDLISRLRIENAKGKSGQYIILIIILSIFDNTFASKNQLFDLRSELTEEDRIQITDVLLHILELPSTSVFNNIKNMCNDLQILRETEEFKGICDLFDFTSRDKNTSDDLISFLTTTSPSVILTWHSIWMSSILKSQCCYSNEDFRNVLRCFGTKFLNDYEFQRNEHIGYICLQYVCFVVDNWRIQSPTSALVQDCMDLVSWFLKLTIESGITSSKILKLQYSILFKLSAAPNSITPPEIDRHFINLLSASLNIDIYNLSEEVSKELPRLNNKDQRKWLAPILEGLSKLPELWESIAVRCRVLEAISNSDVNFMDSIFNIILLGYSSGDRIGTLTTLQRIAESKSLSVRALFDVVSRFVFRIWGNRDHDFVKFPYWLVGYNSMAELITNNLSIIAAEVILSGTDQLQTIFGNDYEESLKYGVPILFALEWDTSSRYPNENNCPKPLRKVNFLNIIRHNIIEVLTEIILTIELNDSRDTPSHSLIVGNKSGETKLFFEPRKFRELPVLQKLEKIADIDSSAIYSSANCLYVFRRIVQNHLIITPLQKQLTVRRTFFLLSYFGMSALTRYCIEQILLVLLQLLQNNETLDRENCVIIASLLNSDFLNFNNPTKLEVEITLELVSKFLLETNVSQLHQSLIDLKDLFLKKLQTGLSSLSEVLIICVRSIEDFHVLFSFEQLITITEDDRLSEKEQTTFLAIFSVQLSRNDFKFTDYSCYTTSRLQRFINKVITLRTMDTSWESSAFKVWLGRLLGLIFSNCGEIDYQQPEWKGESTTVLINSGKISDLAPIIELLNLKIEKRDTDIFAAEESLRILQSNHDYELNHTIDTQILQSTKSYNDEFIQVYQSNSWINFEGENIDWLVSACKTLIKFSNSKDLDFLFPLLEVSLDFTAKCFPFILSYTLKTSPTKSILWIQKAMFTYFENSASTIQMVSGPQRNLIQAILYIRLQSPKLLTTVVTNWKSLVYFSCNLSLNKTALMFLEYYWTFDVVSENEKGQLLTKICKGLNDDDFKYGVIKEVSLYDSIQLENTDGRRHWYSLSYEAAKYDEMKTNHSLDKSETDKLMTSFMDGGLNGVAQILYNVGVVESSEERYQFSWKLQEWDLPTSYKGQKHGTIFSALKALNSIKDRDENLSLKMSFDRVNRALINLFENVYDSAFKSSKLDHWLDVWAILRELEEILDCYRQTPHDNLSIYSMAQGQIARSKKWMHYKKFSHVENLLLARQIGYYILENSVSDSLNRKVDYSFSGLALSHYSDMALNNHEYHKAMMASVKLESLSKEFDKTERSEILRIMSTVTSAKTAWAMGHSSAAIEMLKGVLSSLDIENEFQERLLDIPIIYSLLGQWCSIARHEMDQVIRTEYLEKAVYLLETTRKLKNQIVNRHPNNILIRPNIDLIASNKDAVGHFHHSRAQVYHTFAVFCDEQYNNSESHEFLQTSQKLLDRKKNEIQELKRLSRVGSLSDKSSAAIHLNKIQKIYEIDDNEYRNLQRNMLVSLEKSIEFYMLSISESGQYIEDVSRFCALWLGNSENIRANQVIARQIKKLPSKKFVAWMNQLSSRLLSTKDIFQENLWQLLYSICENHPYHTLYSIIGLRMVVVDSQDEQMKLRSHAGHKFWKELVKRKKLTKQLLDSIETFSQNCVALAQTSVEKKSSHVAFDELPGRSWWVKSLPQYLLPSPTQHISLRDNGYDDIPYIAKVSRNVGIASGLSKPKILKMTLSNGEILHMLIKGGNDDLRQDSIMEQVFDQVNIFLKKSDKSRSRNLSTRTYKVVPLGPSAGIIEFVKFTKPFMEIVQPLHSKYYKEDYDLLKCRDLMKRAQGKSNNARHEVYLGITNHLHPVMRHYFFESSNFPDDWFTMKTNYCRSTAVISMLGYVLGLGDRHCNNILLDSNSGEVVHIDLGIAFDQGKLLRIPETVPFRLTRDIVDGMGITGVEGIFRRCSEFTLEVLRNEIEHITTILNVLRYDPLYSW